MHFHDTGAYNQKILLEIAELMKNKTGLPQICHMLKVSGKTVGLARELVNDGVIVFSGGKPKLIFDVNDIINYKIGKLLWGWAKKNNLDPNNPEDVAEKFLRHLEPFLMIKLRKRGRPKGGSVESQIKIINLLLTECPNFQRIVEAASLNRTVAARNLETLQKMGVINAKKMGRKTFYSMHPLAPVQYIEYLELMGNRKIKRIMKRLKHPFQLYSRLSHYFVKFLPEIIELIEREGCGMMSYIEILKWAAELKKVKLEKGYKSVTYLLRSPTKIEKFLKEASAISGKHAQYIDMLMKSILMTIANDLELRKSIISARCSMSLD